VLKKFAGVDVQLTLVSRGFFPRGGGDIKMCVQNQESHENDIEKEQQQEVGEIVDIEEYRTSAVSSRLSQPLDSFLANYEGAWCAKFEGVGFGAREIVNVYE
jgi:RNA 3'-terminal phosphate cyclase